MWVPSMFCFGKSEKIARTMWLSPFFKQKTLPQLQQPYSFVFVNKQLTYHSAL